MDCKINKKKKFERIINKKLKLMSTMGKLRNLLTALGLLSEKLNANKLPLENRADSRWSSMVVRHGLKTYVAIKMYR